MGELALDSAKMIDLLPVSDQQLIHEMIKKMVLAWDPDFTKVTPAEARAMEEAEQSGYVDEADIDWNNIGIDEE